MTPIDFLAIGHVCKDIVPSTAGYMLGGAVTYGAITAHRLGLKTGIRPNTGSHGKLHG